MADAPLSPHNQRVTAARHLLRAKGRAEAGLFLAEGPQSVREALQLSPVGVVDLLVTAEGARRFPELVSGASASNVRVGLIDEDVLAELAGTVTPQGILAVCRSVDVRLPDVLDVTPRLVALLANVRDPGNAGTVIRCADAAGCDALVVSESSVDVYNPKAVRASAGSLFHLPIVLGVDVVEAINDLQKAGLRVLAADGAGECDLDSELDAGRLGAPTAWVFGNEAWGLPQDVLGACDAVVRVPIHGRAESLNLATAAAVCLYASARAQRPRSVTDTP